MGATNITCPSCNQSDQVQKVTAVVSGSAQILRTRLAPPILPTEPTMARRKFISFNDWTQQKTTRNYIEPRWRRLRPPAFVGIWAFMISPIVGAIGVGILHGQTIPSLRFATGILIFLAAIGFFSSRFNKIYVGHIKEIYNTLLLKHEELESRRYELFMATDHHEWKMLRNQIQSMQNIWETDLYYCHRDDIVFLLSNPSKTAVPPERMREILR